VRPAWYLIRPADFSAILASRSGAPVASDAGGPTLAVTATGRGRGGPARPALDAAFLAARAAGAFASPPAGSSTAEVDSHPARTAPQCGVLRASSGQSSTGGKGRGEREET
jgi:hypothetical protein